MIDQCWTEGLLDHRVIGVRSRLRLHRAGNIRYRQCSLSRSLCIERAGNYRLHRISLDQSLIYANSIRFRLRRSQFLHRCVRLRLSILLKNTPNYSCYFPVYIHSICRNAESNTFFRCTDNIAIFCRALIYRLKLNIDHLVRRRQSVRGKIFEFVSPIFREPLRFFLLLFSSGVHDTGSTGSRDSP